MKEPTTLAMLRARWSQLARRERTLLQFATLLLLATALWTLLLGPALATLRNADAQTRTLDAQIQQMLAMQAQAQSIQQQPPLGYDEALLALTQATRQTLGTAAQITVTGGNASVSLQGVPADALAAWMAQARLNARSTPLEARLTRGAADKGTSASTAWSGVLVMALPPR